jgi:hypothetical protein
VTVTVSTAAQTILLMAAASVPANLTMIIWPTD